MFLLRKGAAPIYAAPPRGPRGGLIRLVENDTSKMINRRKTKCGWDSSDYCYSNLDSSAPREGLRRPAADSHRQPEPESRVIDRDSRMPYPPLDVHSRCDRNPAGHHYTP